MANNVTIRFHKALQDYTYGKESHSINITGSYLDVIRACTSIFPELMNLIKKIARGNSNREELSIIVNGKRLNKDKINFSIKEGDEIFICPVLYGSGRVAMIILIAIILIIAIILAPFTGGTTLYLVMLVISTAIQLIMIPEIPNLTPGEMMNSDIAQARAGTFKGEGLLNTATPVNVLNLVYGNTRYGGHIISGRIKVLNHGPTDLVSVADNI